MTDKQIIQWVVGCSLVAVVPLAFLASSISRPVQPAPAIAPQVVSAPAQPSVADAIQANLAVDPAIDSPSTPGGTYDGGGYSSSRTEHVDGYTRRDGTHVSSYNRAPAGLGSHSGSGHGGGHR